MKIPAIVAVSVVNLYSIAHCSPLTNNLHVLLLFYTTALPCGQTHRSDFRNVARVKDGNPAWRDALELKLVFGGHTAFYAEKILCRKASS